jgi:glycerol-3-phosphate O-acyltransferase
MAWLAQLVGSLPRVGWLAGRFFQNVRVDESFAEVAKRASSQGSVVFVLRSVSVVDALAVAHLAKEAQLPPVGFTHDLPWLPRAFGGGRPRAMSEERALVQALEEGKSAILFLKRPPLLWSATGRGQTEGDAMLEALLELARRGHEIVLVPVALLWTMRPERLGASPIDLVFGPTDMPGDVRAAAQVLLAYQHGALRVGEPTSVREFLASQDAGASPYALVRRLTYALLRKVERERRAVVGPARKTPPRMRDEVMRSPKLTAMISDLSGEDPAKRAEVAARARGILRELAAEPDPDLFRALEPIADGLVRKVFAGVDTSGVERTREAARRGTIVLLPSHKSHVDYLVLAYVLRKNLLEPPVVAAGDNLSFFPIGELLRRGGAFFIRRDFRGDRLYAAVVDAYVRRLLRDGWAIEFYLEGGRSRTGRLLSPKLGLLNLVVDAALSLEGRPVSFIPVSIGYDRLMEDFELAREKAGARKERESARSLLAVADALKYDYGRVTVHFGEPIDLAALRAELGLTDAQLSPAKRRAIVTRLAGRVMGGIQSATLVAAGPLVATALLDMPGRGLAHPDLVAHCERILAIARRSGAEPAPALVGDDGRIHEAAVRDSALVFVRGGLVKEHVPDDTLGRDSAGETAAPESSWYEVIYTVPDEGRSRLDLVKNTILHFFVDRALVAIGFLGAHARAVPRSRVLGEAAALGALLAHEITVFGDAALEERLEKAAQDMIAVGELGATGDTLLVGPGHDLGDAMVLLASHASRLLPVIEAFRVAARALRILRAEPLDDKALLKRTLRMGREMFLGGEIDRREALSGPCLSSAFEAFVQRGVLKRGKDRYEITPDTSDEALRALESYLAAAARARGQTGAAGRRDGKEAPR